MPIPVVCNACRKTIQAPERVAGKKVKCPHCAAVVSIPNAAAPHTPKASPAPAKSWYLKTPEGDDYGPIPKPELDKWFEEGRITAKSQLLEEGADAWQWATDVYSSLQASRPSTSRPAAASPSRPTAPASAGPPVRLKPIAPSSADPFAIAADEGPVAARTGGVGRRRSRRSGNVNLVGVLLYILAGMIVAHRLILMSATNAWEIAERFPGGTSRLTGYLVGTVVVAALYVVAGMGVMNRKEWGRVLALILTALIMIGGCMRVVSSLQFLLRSQHYREYFGGEHGTLIKTVELMLGLFIVGTVVFTYMTLLKKRHANEFETARERE